MTKFAGNRIKELRKLQSLTLEGLADKIGSSKSYIWELENNQKYKPSAEKLNRIAKALKVPMEYLIDDSAQMTEADALDQEFFRRYQRMGPETKIRIRKAIELLCGW